MDSQRDTRVFLTDSFDLLKLFGNRRRGVQCALRKPRVTALLGRIFRRNTPPAPKMSQSLYIGLCRVPKRFRCGLANRSRRRARARPQINGLLDDTSLFGLSILDRFLVGDGYASSVQVPRTSALQAASVGSTVSVQMGVAPICTLGT